MFRVDIRTNSSEEMLELDADTRRYVSERSPGDYIGHWIPTNLHVGDSITLNPSLQYTVHSANDTLRLVDVEGGIGVRAFRLLAGFTITDPLGVKWDVSITRHYEALTGLWIGSVLNATVFFGTLNGTLKQEVVLVGNGIDTDGDSLTDLKELFVTHSNPVLVDTDNDFWNDVLDPLPTNGLIPNTLLVALVLSAAIAVILILKWSGRTGETEVQESQSTTFQ